MSHTPAPSTAPAMYRTLLAQSGAIPLLGAVTPRDTIRVGHSGREIGGVAIMLDPARARSIVTLAALTRSAVYVFGASASLTVGVPAPACLTPAVRTTCPDVLVRGCFMEADERGELIVVDPADVARATRVASVPADIGSPVTARLSVDFDSDTVRWTLITEDGATLDVAPLPLDTVRFTVAAADELGM